MNHFFQFKQFAVRQDNCAMKVGTDGVLLGAWANIQSAGRILDIGTGTGLIALMLAQRAPETVIDAIEIEENAYRQACENVGGSLWKNRINVIHQSLQTFESNYLYDLIVSNPPYFSDSLKNPDSSKKIARHTDFLTFNDLIIHSKRLLHPEGRLCIIYPATEASSLIKKALENGFYCFRITKVIPKPNAKEKRLLIEFSLTSAVCAEDEICIESNGRHGYSDEYKTLTKDFYLNC